MHSLISHTLAGFMVMAAASAAAAPPAIVAHGKGDAVACAACHGADGAGNARAGYPMLAHLPAVYLAKQLADFKAGSRNSPVMSRFAKALSTTDIDTVARYYAALPRPAVEASEAGADAIAPGRELAVNGAWDRGVPPCFKCHAVDGTGIAPVFPPIAGQHAAYTVSQLQAWKSGSRANDPHKLMRTVAQHMTESDIDAVADYLATLGPKGTPK
jgi:cytochrome c553